ncbi:MAG: tRNA (N(6)-L-threonylcarbamoyladenosine(37)-C(2))-methylthiotransferase MtaB [Magnetococcus sp. DMHC-6]
MQRENRPKRMTILTLGCRVNQLETEQMRQEGLSGGFQSVEAGETADLVVINTCSVTKESEREARQLIRRAAREHPQARIVVTGCYAQRDPDTLASLPQVDMVLGNGEKYHLSRFLQALPTLSEGGWKIPSKINVGDPVGSEEWGHQPLLVTPNKTRIRASLHVQNGCNGKCTFCLLPVIRGPSRSISLEKALEQARQFLYMGFQELVVTGIDLGAWGRDFSPTTKLADLVAALLLLPGLQRLRLSSLDPAHLDDSLLHLFATQERLCPHLHLSIQSGDDLILKRMGRRHNRQQVLERLERLRGLRPEMVLGADFIVGFPTETPEAFVNTLELVVQAELSLLHVFRYSDRPGSAAAAIPKHSRRSGKKLRVEGPELQERAQRLRQVGLGVWRTVAKRYINQRVSMLIESVEGGLCRGKNDGFLSVHSPATEADQPGMLKIVSIHHLDEASMALVGI